MTSPRTQGPECPQKRQMLLTSDRDGIKSWYSDHFLHEKFNFETSKYIHTNDVTMCPGTRIPPEKVYNLKLF